MLRRTLILGLGLVLASATDLSAAAQDVVSSITDQLRAQGFSRIETQRTLLGRTRIIATGDGGTREIIVNANTGEILRDLWQPEEEADDDSVKVLNREGSGRSGSASGKTSGSSDDGGDRSGGSGGGDSGGDDPDSRDGSNSGSGKGDGDGSGGSDGSGHGSDD